jgi:hypothetical protein
MNESGASRLIQENSEQLLRRQLHTLLKFFHPDKIPDEYKDAAGELTKLLNAIKDQGLECDDLPKEFPPGSGLIIFRAKNADHADKTYEVFNYVLPATVTELLTYLEWFTSNTTETEISASNERATDK